MFALKVDRLKLNIAIAFFLLLLCIAAPQAMASQPCAVSPASGAVTILPNVLVIFDNSGSMTYYAHQDAYNSATTYAGIFDSGARYNYNAGEYFVQAAGGDWSGNFLNWACMQRIDVSRKIMTGGKVIVSGGNTYITANTWSLDAPERTYNDTTSQTPWAGSYKYQFRNNTGSEWGLLRVRNTSDVTQDTYYIRILVSAGYVAQGLLHDLENKVRLGIMHFNTDRRGGEIRRYVQKLDSTHLGNIVSDLNRNLGDDYDWSYTPLAETLYNATRYFSQDTPAYHGTDYTESRGDYPNDPLYNEDYGGVVWCAKNYVVLLTDGESTEDREIPAGLQDYDGDGCDNCSGNAGCPCCCTADYTCSCPLELDGTAYLDDVAKYAHDTDLRGASQDNLLGDQNLTLHAVYMFGQPGWADVLLEKATDENHGNGIYSRAENADQILTALQTIFDQITQQAAAAASTAITSEPVSGVDLIYIPYFKHPQDDQWWGNIRAFELDEDGNLINDSGNVASDTDGDLVLDDPVWDAAAALATLGANNRTIFTYISGAEEDFDTSNAATVGKYLDVDLDNNSTEDEPLEVNALINYIRGTDNPGGFDLRDRYNNYLGDIMHASPAFVGKPSARFDLIYGDSTYWTFYWNNDTRTPVLYAGANDGMLHCFDANNGQELWAYIPYNLLPHLKWLADSYSCHSYYVDLSANVWDMKIGSTPAWKSILIGGMRIGGTPDGVDTTVPSDGTTDETLSSALFALDVTNPNNPQVLWENNDELNGRRFGYTVSKPIPVKVEDSWYLVFGSGPKTRTGAGDPTADGGDGYTDPNGYIFVVNPEDGTVSRSIDLGTNNFFSSPVAIDYDLDYNVDLIYIGDAKGNLWRIKTFTVSGGVKTYYTSPANWIIDVDASTPGVIDPLLSLGTDQPILLKPAISMDERGRVWIYFGTGRYFCANDNQYCDAGDVCPTSGSCIESEFGEDRSKFMAVGVFDRHWDTDQFVLQDNTIYPNDLDRRAIKLGTIVGTGDVGYYVVDYVTGQLATDVDPSTKGWYFHLLEEGERCLGDFLVYQGAAFFITFTPDISDPCARGGLSNLYGVHYISGTSTLEPIFDMTGEGDIDSDDLVTDGSNTYGPAIQKLNKGFAGGSPKIKNKNLYTPLPDKPRPIEPPGDESSTGVTSWREVLQ